MPDDKKASWWKVLGKSVLTWFLRYPAAIIGTVLLAAIALCLVCFGKTIQIGGLLGWLWGRKAPDPGLRVIPPAGRVDDHGVPIPAGQSDAGGYVQAPVQVVIKDPGIFSDPDTIVVDHPTKGEVVIPLPTGVKNTDVKQVTEVEPNVYQLSNNDRPSVDAGKLLDDLEKKP